MNQELAGQSYAGPVTVAADNKPQLTTLANGLRVVSYNSNQASAHVGVHLDAGSRYEDASNHGISTLLELSAFKSTTNRSAFRLARESQQLGITLGASSGRETFTYAADTLRESVPHVLGTISDLMLNSTYKNPELAETKDLYLELFAEPKAEHPDIVDAIHAAAYKNNTYGFSPHATKAQLDNITTESLINHTAKFHTSDRMVVSAVGVEHAELVDLANEYLGNVPASSSPVETVAPTYTGGIQLAPGGADGLTHFSFGFQAPSWNDADVIPLLVLQTLMGGGGAFSAGGPGKGMMTRVYRNVLNGHPWVINAKADANVYNDTGLFTLSGSVVPSDAANLADVLVKEAKNMTGAVTDVELARAKNQLKSSILLSLENRQVQQQDMASQVLSYGSIQDVNAWITKINAVKGSDIQTLAAKILSTPASVAASGDVSNVPTYEQIASQFRA